MKNSLMVKILCSYLVIFLALYFLPVVGILLILFRYFVYRDVSNNNVPAILLIIGVLLTIPRLLKYLVDTFNPELKIPFLQEIMVSNVYFEMWDFSKLLITLGVVLFILSYIYEGVSKKISSELGGSLKKFIEDDLKKDEQIRRENDMKMQEKREKAKNTHVVYCPYCGSDNMLTESTGTCKFCCRKIEFKESK